MATWIQKYRLLQGLVTGERAGCGPFYADVDVTDRCNMNCIGCSWHGPDGHRQNNGTQALPDMSPALFGQICRSLSAMRTGSIILQGRGEPLLHPRIFDMIQMAGSSGMHTTLLSNGSLLSEETVDELIVSGPDTLKISLWAVTPDQFAANYPGNPRHYFEDILNGLSLLRDKKKKNDAKSPEVIIYFVFNENNQDSIPDAVDLAVRYGCDGLFFSPMRPLKPSGDSHSPGSVEVQTVTRALEQAGKRLRSLAMAENIRWALFRMQMSAPLWHHMPCYISWYHLRIRTDGRVQPCGRCDETICFGNINHASLEEIWNGPGIRRFRNRTMTRSGLKSLSGHCECDSCCFARDNARIYRRIRPLYSMKILHQ